MSTVNTTQVGQRLIHQIIDERARSGHSRPYAAIPCTTNISDGFQDISWQVFANAINRCAAWMQERLGVSSTCQAVAYLGPLDLRYQIIAVAAGKTGHAMFFPSPRNSMEAFESLMREADVKTLIAGTDKLPVIANVVQRCSLERLDLPTLEELLDPKSVPHVQFEGTFVDHRHKPWVYLHTSGSTALPKLIAVKHGLIAAADAFQLLENNEVGKRYGNKRVLVAFPPFHIAGLSYSLPSMCWLDSTVVMPPSGVVTSDMVHAMHQHGNVEHSMLVPSLVKDLASKPDTLATLGQLSGITFAGGPLDPQTTRTVAEVTKLASTLGATEYGSVPLSSKPKALEDINYFRFSDEIGGLEFREVSGQPGLFELVMVRDPSIDIFQPIFVTFPDLQEYPTKDCFSKHPTEAGLWKYESRIDDILVLSNGEKLNPVPMEGIINRCPGIKGSLVVGKGHFQTALPVEPKEDVLDKQSLLNSLKSYLEQANTVTSRYGRIDPDNVVFATADKPFARTGKGTVQRAKSVSLYKDEIDSLYGLEKGSEKNSVYHDLDLSSQSAARISLQTFIADEIGLSPDELGPDADFFAFGMDSLQVLSLAKAMTAARPKDKPPVNPTLIYKHPTVSKLSTAISNGLTIKEYSDFDSDDEDDIKAWEKMEETLEHYRADMTDIEKSGETGRGRLPRRLREAVKSHARPPLYQPDGGMKAWLQVVGSFLINMNNWGLVNSFGVYQAYYQFELLQDYSASDIAWIRSLQGALLLLIGAISGPLFDKGYFRLIQVVAGLGVVFALMMLSLARSYYSVMLSQGVLLGICLGFLYIPSVALIPLYFKKSRGLALGLATAGGSFGGVLFPIIFRRLLNEIGFGWANRVMGFLALATMLVSVALMRPIGTRSTRQLLDLKALAELPYVCFMIAGLLLFAGVLVPFFLVTIYAEQNLSASTDVSFYLLAVLNAAQLFGRVLPAVLSDHVGGELMLLGAIVFAGVLGFCWMAVYNLVGYVVWLVVYGLVSGAVVTLPAVVLPYLCPSMAVLGTRLGMIYAAGGVGFLISSPVALAINDSTGGYTGSQAWIGACCFVAAAFNAVAAKEAWTRRQLYKSS